MNFRGRQIDPVSFWEQYVSFGAGRIERDDEFAPLVECPNPAHDTMKRHFQINLQQPTVHCFARCGIEGSYEHAVCVIEGLYEKFDVGGAENERERKRRKDRAYREAKKRILKTASPASKFRRRATVRKKVGSPTATPSVRSDLLEYERFLPQSALEYVEGRGISSGSVSAWELGWLPDERRIVIPAHDEHGHLKFLIKRAVRAKDQPKYLYTEGFPKSRLLFGICHLDIGLVSSLGLILVEGSVDTILFHQHGLRNTGGILGTGISEEQRRIVARINPPRVIFAFDKDSAGITNIEIASAALKKYPQYVMLYPKKKSDPSELSEREAHRQISKAIPFRDFKARMTRRERITVG